MLKEPGVKTLILLTFWALKNYCSLNHSKQRDSDFPVIFAKN